MRVLICGGRNFPDLKAVWDWIEQNLGSGDTVIHGACPTGADAFADVACATFRIPVERFPADWSRGPKGGPERNLRMIDSRPGLVVAFWDGLSRGTRGTLLLAAARGIPYKIVIQDGCDQYVSNALTGLEAQARLL